MPDPQLPDPPDTLEGYRIGARIRRSGSLVVHAGTSRLELPVEASFVRCDSFPTGFDADDFLAGVRRAANVHHEALLPYVTGGRWKDLVFAIAKVAEGRTLDEIVATEGPLSETRALALAKSVAGALAALERGGMRHGDLAPQRIVLAGMSAFVVAPPRIVPSALAPRPDRWQAPEEARGGENGVQSDLFVLGLILVEVLTGTHPLAAIPDARRALRDWTPPDLDASLRRASPEMRVVVARLLAPEPANRFATAGDALGAIEDAGNHPETAPIAIPVAAEVPTLRALPRTAKSDAGPRAPGRLQIDGRLGESTLELDDDVTFVGEGTAKNVRAQADAFPEAVLRVERTPAADVVHGLKGEVKVNGVDVPAQALADGDRIDAPGISARYERAPRPAARAGAAPVAPPSNPLAGAITVTAILVTMIALAWGVSRILDATKESGAAKSMAAVAEQRLEEERRLVAPSPAGDGASSPVAQAERAARDAFEAAALWGRKHPSEARNRYLEVWRRHPETAYGLLARMDALEIERRSRPAPDRVLEDLIAASETPDGGTDEATMSKLRTYAEDNPGTVAGQRALLALVKSQAVQRGRFDADIAAIRAAVARKDWREALTLAEKTLAYAPIHLQEEVRAEKAKVIQGMGETLRESPGGGAKRGGGGPPVGGGPGTAKGDDPPAGKPAAEDRNQKAEALFLSARELMDKKKDEIGAMGEFLTFLREYKDTPTGELRDIEVRTRISSLSLGPAGIVKLFRGNVEKLEKGRWRVTYDFEDAEQLKDFRDVLAFDLAPRANWKVDGGAVKSSKGSGALVLDAMFTPDQVTAAVKVIPRRPHDLGVILMEPQDQRFFYLFTLQNTFFTLGRGDAAKPFEENAVVLYGPNMWKDRPQGELGYVRKCGSAEPAVRENEAVPIRVGKADAEVWMKFEGGKSIRGSAYGDLKYDFKGIAPGVFVVNGEGSFDELVVEGTPDLDWVKKRWRAILSAL